MKTTRGDALRTALAATMLLAPTTIVGAGCSSSGSPTSSDDPRTGTDAVSDTDPGSDVADTSTDAGRADAGEDARGSDGGDDVPSYQTVWSTLDSKHGCTTSVCHGGRAPAINSYDDLIGVASDCDGSTLVEPGEPADSLFYRKIDPDLPADQVCGTKMPQGAGSVSAEDADAVRRWIAGGAPR